MSLFHRCTPSGESSLHPGQEPDIDTDMGQGANIVYRYAIDTNRIFVSHVEITNTHFSPSAGVGMKLTDVGIATISKG